MPDTCCSQSNLKFWFTGDIFLIVSKTHNIIVLEVSEKVFFNSLKLKVEKFVSIELIVNLLWNAFEVRFPGHKSKWNVYIYYECACLENDSTNPVNNSFESSEICSSVGSELYSYSYCLFNSSSSSFLCAIQSRKPMW